MKLRYILTIKIVYFSILKCDYRLYKVKKGTIMDISTQYKSYIQATNTDITSEQAKKMDERKLKEAAQGLEAEFFKIFLKQSKNILLKNKNEENKAPGKDIMTDFMLERFAEDMAGKYPLGLSEMIIKDVKAKNPDIESDKIVNNNK